jgi:uncharacterized protein (DUF1501 family)
MAMDRRHFVTASACIALSAAAPRMLFAKAATQRRFVFIIQRGAADGLATLAPAGDPAFEAARGQLAEDFINAPRIDGMFALHPALQEMARLYAEREVLFAHAIASAYRDRSHFDGQNVLETGGSAPYRLRDGWLNRLLGVLPSSARQGIALAATVPMALRGPVVVASHAPSALPEASDDLVARVSALYADDPQLHALWAQAAATRKLTGDMESTPARNAAASGELAARLLTPADGARVAMIEMGGWDTHAQQRPRLAAQLRGLDSLLGALRTGMGTLWSDTLVLVATEFGRTVAVNGTGGTDHGTAALAMLVGGNVQGGRVLADWPGLAAANLHEGRDLKATQRLDDFAVGALAGHFGLEPLRLARALFPQSDGKPMEGLVRSRAA